MINVTNLKKERCNWMTFASGYNGAGRMIFRLESFRYKKVIQKYYKTIQMIVLRFLYYFFRTFANEALF